MVRFARLPGGGEWRVHSLLALEKPIGRGGALPKLIIASIVAVDNGSQFIFNKLSNGAHDASATGHLMEAKV
jgi:hypothetical protein